MATLEEVLADVTTLLARYSAALSVDGGSKLLTLDRTNNGDTAAVIFKQGGAERFRAGQFGLDTFAIQYTPSGAAVDFANAVSIDRATGAVTMAGAMRITAGTAGAPGLAFSGDTNTGIYSPGADQIGIATGGTARLVVAAGLVGVGTTSPVNEMDVNGAVGVTYADGLRLYRDTGTVNNSILAHSFSGGDLLTLAPAGNSPNSFIAFGTAASSSLSEKMRIDQLGRVGIGTSSPNAAAALDITSTVRGFLPPRMTGVQRDAISSPPDGLIIYHTVLGKLQVRSGGAWVNLH